MNKHETLDGRTNDRLLSAEAAYDVAAPYYDKWAWQRIWRTVEHQSIKSALDGASMSPAILDIGCGTGTLLNIAQQSLKWAPELVGIDLSYKMLSRARERLCGKNIKLIHGDFLDFGFSDKSYDIIFMCRVATHIKNIGEAIHRVASLLNENGKFVFSSVDSRHNYDVTRVPFGKKRVPILTYKHSYEDIAAEITKNNLCIESIKAFTVDDLSSTLKLAPDLPRSLVAQVSNAQIKIPFGYIITCSKLRNEAQKKSDLQKIHSERQMRITPPLSTHRLLASSSETTENFDSEFRHIAI